MSEKFALNNKEREGKELVTLFNALKERKMDGNVESVQHQVVMMLLCIGESPAKGDYVVPKDFSFKERLQKRSLLEQLNPNLSLVSPALNL